MSLQTKQMGVQTWLLSYSTGTSGHVLVGVITGIVNSKPCNEGKTAYDM